MGARLTARELIEKLCGFDTTSRLSNLELIHFIADYLDGHGIASDLIHDETGAKANLFATIGPELDGGIVLSGHTDVVPVDGQDWSHDPFDVIERDNKLFGRGVADMKSFIAIALSLAPDFKSSGLSTPIHFAFSYDEEVGCLGVHGLISHLEGLTTRPKAVIVGEPTDMTVVNAHKAFGGFQTTITGLEAHSSATQLGVNSIFFAGDVIRFINDLAAEYRERDNDRRYSPPYTTVNVGMISGGTAPNIIPKETKIVWEFRALEDAHGEDIVARVQEYCAQEIEPRMREVYPEARAETVVKARIVGLLPEDGSAAETLALQLVGSNQTYAVSYATEGGLFQQSGIPTVVCGPGNIEQAHKPDEYIALSQVEACADFMRRLMQLMATA